MAGGESGDTETLSWTRSAQTLKPSRTVRARGPLVALLVAVVSLVGPALLPRVDLADAATTLTPVRSLIATATGDTAVISWQAPVTGSVARYKVDAHLKDPYNTYSNVHPDYGTRYVSGSATSITWDRLPLNQPVHFTVTAIGPDGAAGASGP